MTTSNIIVLCAFAFYMLVMIGIGAFYSRKTKNNEDYFLKSCEHRVIKREVEYYFAVITYGINLFESAVTAAHTCGHNNKRWFRYHKKPPFCSRINKKTVSKGNFITREHPRQTNTHFQSYIGVFQAFFACFFPLFRA